VHRYSSVSAFLAHYEILRKISPSSQTDDDRNQLAALEQLVATLRPEERAAVDSNSSDPTIVRHRERATIRLRRELNARGLIDG
jgi:hypothetical protein